MCIAQVRRFLLEPEKAFKKERKTKLWNVFTYYLTLGIVFAVLGGAVWAVMGMSLLPFFVVGIMLYLSLIVGAVFGGLWLHFWAWLFGAKKGLEQTFKVVLFSATPTLLFGWIPLAGWLFGLWSLVLQVIGLKELQKMSTERAVLTVIVPALIVLAAVIAMMALVAVLFLPFMGPHAFSMQWGRPY